MATANVPTAVIFPRSVPRRARFGLSAIRVQAISDEPDSGDARSVEGDVDFLAEVPDIDLDDVRVAVVVLIPDVCEDVRL